MVALSFRHRHRPVYQLPCLRACLQGEMHLYGRPFGRLVALCGLLRLCGHLPRGGHTLHNTPKTALHPHDATRRRRGRDSHQRLRPQSDPPGCQGESRRTACEDRPAQVSRHRLARRSRPGPVGNRRYRREVRGRGIWRPQAPAHSSGGTSGKAFDGRLPRTLHRLRPVRGPMSDASAVSVIHTVRVVASAPSGNGLRPREV